MSIYFFRCLGKKKISYRNTFSLEMFWTTLPFEALPWHTSNLTRSMLLTAIKVFGQLHFVVCMWTIYSPVYVLLFIFNKLMSKLNLCFEFCLEVIQQRLKFFCTPYWTDLGMLRQIIHYGKIRGNILPQTWSTKMPTFRDQMRVRAKVIFTHIIQIGVNWDWWL